MRTAHRANAKSLYWQSLALGALLLPSAWIAAAQGEPHDTTREAAVRPVDLHHTASPERIQIKVGKINSPLRLPMCNRPPATVSRRQRHMQARYRGSVNALTLLRGKSPEESGRYTPEGPTAAPAGSGILVRA